MENGNERLTEVKTSVVRKAFRKCLRVVVLFLAAVILLVAGILTALVVVLSPERLTPLVAKYSSEYIDGSVSASRIELTFWSTFPRLSVDIDSLSLVSGAFDNLDPDVRQMLPADADTLLTLRSLHGGINLVSLLAGRYELYDVALSQPAVNIVVANDSVANYNLVASSPGDTVKNELPFLSINRFLLLNSGPLKYFSLPDSTEFALCFSAIDANGADSPIYSMAAEGNVRIAGLPIATDGPLLFTADGRIEWNPETPSELALKSFVLSVDGTPAKLDTRVRFDECLTIEHLEVELPSVDVTRVSGYLPEEALADVGNFDTNMNIAVSFKLSRPYMVLPDTVLLPSGVADLKINPCRLSLEKIGLSLDRLSFGAQMTVDGDNLDMSVLEVNEFKMKSRVLDLDFVGSLKHPLTDPVFAGQLKGRAFIGYLPQAVKDAMGGSMRGTLGTDLSVRLRRSDLAANRFHRIFARGTVSLRQFDMAMSSDSVTGDTLRFVTPAAFLRFDSDRKIEVNGVSTDSLLTVSINADTISYSGSGISILAHGLNVGLGSRNVYSSSDTTRINPFGGSIKASQFRLVSLPDSLRVAVNMLDCNASLRRFEGKDSVPLLALSVVADGIGVGDRDFRAAVKSPSVDVTAHLNPRRRSLRSDSLAARVARHPRVDDNDNDSITTGLRELISRWKILGNISASRGQMLSRAFPLVTRIGDVDLAFSSDSIDLRSLTLQLGRTDLRVRGDITNLEQWASRRRPSTRRPIRIGVRILSDTVDIDQLTAACLSGDVDSHADVAIQDMDDYTGDLVPLNAAAVDSAGGPFIIPVNIEAMIDVKASNVIYSDMLMHDFSGELQTRGGIMRLRDLSAQGDVGRIDVSALYSSLMPDSLEFGMGMRLSNFHLDRFLEVVPSLDTLLPAMRDLSGIVNADVAATTRLDRDMNFVIPSLKAVIDIEGDSLVLLDDRTFKSMSKWLVFKDKKRNLIDHMKVKIAVDSSLMSIYPFVFDIDRYRLGVMGSNDLDMNLNYHVSVIKSPLPWKFGINIKGTPDNMKIRLGGAKVKENGEGYVEQLAIADTTRINLVSQLESLFNRGMGVSRSSFTRRRSRPVMQLDDDLLDPGDTIPVELPDSLRP